MPICNSRHRINATLEALLLAMRIAKHASNISFSSLILIDNNSDKLKLTEKQLAKWHEAYYLHCKFLYAELDGIGGSGNARQAGVAIALRRHADDLLMFLDDDVHIGEDWIINAVNAMASNASIVSGKILPSEECDKALQTYGGRDAWPYFACQDFGEDRRIRDWRRLKCMPGAVFMCKAKLWIQEQILPGRNKHSMVPGDDFEQQIRMCKLEGEIIYEPNCIAWHHFAIDRIPHVRSYAWHNSLPTYALHKLAGKTSLQACIAIFANFASRFAKANKLYRIALLGELASIAWRPNGNKLYWQ